MYGFHISNWSTVFSFLSVFTQPFKAEIFPKLRTAFDGMRLRVPFDVDCREDLHEMQQVISNGNYSYKAPRTDAGHSDRCTALALAVRAAAQSGPVLPPIIAKARETGDERSL